MSFGMLELSAFVRVAALGSIHKAAEEIGISQPALTLRLQKLETSLGATLFDRTTRTISLTVVGQDFLPDAKRILQDFDRSVSTIKDIIAQRAGRVSFACLNSVAVYLMPGIIKKFNARYPNVRTRVLDDTGQRIIEHVQTGEAEFAIDLSPDRDGFVFERLFDDEIVLVCHPDHYLADLKSLKWKDVHDHQIVLLAPSSGFQRHISRMLKRSEDDKSAFYQVQHVSTCLEFVRTGVGPGILPKLAIKDIVDNQLVWRPIIEPKIQRPIGIVRRRGSSMSPAAKSLLSLIKSELSFG